MGITEFIVNREIVIRHGFFFGVLGTMALWEWLTPRRVLTIPKPLRWVNNIGIMIINTLLLRIIFPSAAVGMAIFAQKHGWGLLNYIHVSYAIATIISVIAMDFVIYLQHVMFHAVPIFWRIHRMHHADLDFDVTTGIRFHPFEIILSMLIKFAVIVAIGPPVLGIIIFEVLLNATSMFNHGNVRILYGLDRILRWIVVTPEMHRVHHSVVCCEINSNFGFNLPLWDRFLGTYCDQPRMGHEGMTIGLGNFRDIKNCAILPSMLAIPFIGEIVGYTINRRK
jgi:sterol desaturase/sphingolipid hydroxylase (fatty acid hydroxylase superfamily)